MADSFSLAACLDQMRAVELRLQQLLSNVSDTQFTTRPAGDSWSPSECIEHLLITGREFQAEWDRILATNPPPSEPKPYNLLLRTFRNIVEPPYKLKVQTPPLFIPQTAKSKAVVEAAFLEMHRQAEKRLHQLSRSPQSPFRSPFASWMTYPAGFSFDVFLAHERRHLWQAEAAIENTKTRSAGS